MGEDVVRLTGFFTTFRGMGVVGDDPTGFFLVGVAFTTGGVALFFRLALLGGDLRPPLTVLLFEPVGDVLPEDTGEVLGLSLALGLEVTEDLLGTAGGEVGGADLGGGGGGLVGSPSSNTGGGGEVGLFCDLSNCDFKA